jgi:phage I-like protein
MTKTDMPRFVVLLSEAGEPGALVRIALAKIGTWWKGKQKIRITRDMLSQVVANFRKRPNGEVPIDYDHGIEYAAGSGAAVPAAGWIKAIEDAPDEHGILWAMAEWTEKAAEHIRGREYKYFSPVIDPGTRDNKTGEQQGWTLTSAALTNIPVLQDLPAIALSEAGWNEIAPDGGDEEEKTTVITKLIMADRAAGMVRAILEDGREVTLAVEGLAPEPKVLRLSEVKRSADGRFDFAPLAELPGGTLIASEVIHAINVQTELDAAVKDGKITPAQRPAIEKLALSDLPAFREFVKAQKPQVDLTERGIGGDGTVVGSDLQKVDGQIRQFVADKQKADPNLRHLDAMRAVLSEHPDLEKRRRELMG